jgi:protoporphyrin/coproporphyrin ferrochelatase
VSQKIDAVFFISFGGPEKREDVRPFLEIVTHGRRIPPERIDEVAHHYEVIGGKSPINEITNRQAEALRKLLDEPPHPSLSPKGERVQGEGLPVYVGNRNWHPFLEDTLRKMAADGIRHTVGFVTAAHRTEASWSRYVNAVEAARQKVGPEAPTVTYNAPWFDHPLFIEAICERIKEVRGSEEARKQGSDPLASSPSSFLARCSWVFTAHSIPTPMAEESRYVQELEATAGLVCARFGVQKWKLAYTSRSGAPTDAWLEPDVCDEIRAQAKQGVRDILAIPIGFVADHVEVLFDLDVEARQAAQEAGVTLHRAQTVSDHPLFIRMIADVIKKAVFPQLPSPLAGEGKDEGYPSPVPSPARGEGHR